MKHDRRARDPNAFAQQNNGMDFVERREPLSRKISMALIALVVTCAALAAMVDALDKVLA